MTEGDYRVLCGLTVLEVLTGQAYLRSTIPAPSSGYGGGVLNRGEDLPKTVEATAQEQVDAVRTVQKTGPYHLMGFSNGGIITFELACQLQEQGERTAFLGLIDVSARERKSGISGRWRQDCFPGRTLGKIPAFIERSLKAHPDSWFYQWIMKAIRMVFHGVLFRSAAKSLPGSVAAAHSSINLKEETLAFYPAGSHANMKVQLERLPYVPPSHV